MHRKTGHAESIQIEFDPKLRLLKKYLIFSGIHTPTSLNNKATMLAHNTDLQYFIITKNKRDCWEIKKSEKEGAYKDPIVTEITFRIFMLQRLTSKLLWKQSKCSILVLYWSQSEQTASKYGNNVRRRYIR